MLRELRQYGEIPLLAFDFKGDISDSLGEYFRAEIVSPPRVPVPLDVLHVGQSDDTSLREAAGRIRESIGRVKSGRIGGVQSEALREAILSTLRGATRGQKTNLGDVARSLEANTSIGNVVQMS